MAARRPTAAGHEGHRRKSRLGAMCLTRLGAMSAAVLGAIALGFTADPKCAPQVCFWRTESSIIWPTRPLSAASANPKENDRRSNEGEQQRGIGGDREPHHNSATSGARGAGSKRAEGKSPAHLYNLSPHRARNTMLRVRLSRKIAERKMERASLELQRGQRAGLPSGGKPQPICDKMPTP